MPNDSKWDPEEVIVLVIAATVCLSVLAAVFSPLITSRELSDAEANILGQVITGLLAIVSFRLGKQTASTPKPKLPKSNETT